MTPEDDEILRQYGTRADELKAINLRLKALDELQHRKKLLEVELADLRAKMDKVRDAAPKTDHAAAPNDVHKFNRNPHGD